MIEALGSPGAFFVPKTPLFRGKNRLILPNYYPVKWQTTNATHLIKQLQQAVEKNEALIVSRKKAIHTITHELRTPLTAIIGYTALMEKVNDADKKERYTRGTG